MNGVLIYSLPLTPPLKPYQHAPHEVSGEFSSFTGMFYSRSRFPPARRTFILYLPLFFSPDQNHISVDSEAAINLMVFQMVMWSAIIQLVGFVMMLFWVLGISAISGLSLIFLSLPINKVWCDSLGFRTRIYTELIKRKGCCASFFFHNAIVCSCMSFTTELTWRFLKRYSSFFLN